MNTFYKEKYRPQYHYSPRINWLNDPNGLIWHNGIFHMYYQYNPLGSQWDNMSWGHATSNDLVFWKEHDVAIHMTKHMIFSGTTAIDVDNDSGLCHNEKGVVAMYTSFEYERDKDDNIKAIAQHQSLAVSTDDGYTYKHYKGNPVLDIMSTEFRDPKIFKYQDNWVMLVSLADQHKIAFYQSEDLKNWKEVSQFGNIGDTNSVWECPDLFPLQIGETTKWILTLSAGHPQGNGYYAMQYFIGQFDGKRFTTDDLYYPRYLDFGKDFYAGITYANTKSEDYVIMMAWLGCHSYTKDTPTTTWRGAMSLPRELRLKEINNQLHLVGQVSDVVLDKLTEVCYTNSLINVQDKFDIPFESRSFYVEFEISKPSTFAGVEVLSDDSHKTIIGYISEKHEVFMDRTNSGNVSFNPQFPSMETAPLISASETLNFKIYVDHSVVEVFVNNGEIMITDRVFPLKEASKITLFSNECTTAFRKVSVRTLKSIW